MHCHARGNACVAGGMENSRKSNVLSKELWEWSINIMQEETGDGKKIFCHFAEVWRRNGEFWKQAGGTTERLEIQKYTHLYDSSMSGYKDNRMTSMCLTGIIYKKKLYSPLCCLALLTSRLCLLLCLRHKTANIHIDFQFLEQHFRPRRSHFL